MSANPIVHNDGGFFRFTDFVSLMPEFLKAEEDVVAMLQLFSDYINNAYRNTSTASTFSISMVCRDSQVGAAMAALTRLSSLMKLTESSNDMILWLAKPQGNPKVDPSLKRPIFSQYIKYGSAPEFLDSSVITGSPVDGDKYWIEFTDANYSAMSAVYMYDVNLGQLIKDPNGTSQDPFTGTQNRPTVTQFGITPRMLAFRAKDIGDVYVRVVQGQDNYSEVFFSAFMYDFMDLPSIIPVVAADGSKYAIDYLGSLNAEFVPTGWTSIYQISMAASCTTGFDWQVAPGGTDRALQGDGLFYARDNSLSGVPSTIDISGNQSIVDPMFSENSVTMSIVSITSDVPGSVTVTLMVPSILKPGDKIRITGTPEYDGAFIVSEIVSAKVLKYSDSSVFGSPTRFTGELLVPGLYYSRDGFDTSKKSLVVPVSGSFPPTNPILTGDVLVRYDDAIPAISSTFDAGTDVNAGNDTIKLNSISGFSVGDSVVVSCGSAYPTPLVSDTIYTISSIDTSANTIKLTGVDITSPGTNVGTVTVVNDYVDIAAAINPLDGWLKLTGSAFSYTIGDLIRVNITSWLTTFPAEFNAFSIYRIIDIDAATTSILLNGINSISWGYGLMAVSKIQLDYQSSFVVDRYTYKNGLYSIVTESHIGDCITNGRIARIRGSDVYGIAAITGSTVAWSSVPGTFYAKNSYVYRNESRFRVLRDTIIGLVATPPERDTSTYRLDMDSITAYAPMVFYNSLMWGMKQSMLIEESQSPDYREPTDVLTSRIYVSRTDDNRPKYGYIQRSWVTSPTQAGNSDTHRNGFIDIVECPNEPSDIVAVDMVNSSVCRTQGNIANLYGIIPIGIDITEISYSLILGDYVVTAKLVGNHGYSVGAIVEISGVPISQYNGDVELTYAVDNVIKYVIQNEPSSADTVGRCTFTPKAGQYITVELQDIPQQNGLYEVSEQYWLKYDGKSSYNGKQLFTPYNAFTADDLINPRFGSSTPIDVEVIMYVGETTLSGNPVGVAVAQFAGDHGLIPGATMTIRGSTVDEYNGSFTVVSTPAPDTAEFRVSLAGAPYDIETVGYMSMVQDTYFLYSIDGVDFQAKTSYLTSSLQDGATKYDAPASGFKYNIPELAGLPEVTLVTYGGSTEVFVRLKSGDHVYLYDQLSSEENGEYVVATGRWSRVAARRIMKISDFSIDSFASEVSYEIPNEYRQYTLAEAYAYQADQLAVGKTVFISRRNGIRASQFTQPVIANIDTTDPINEIYDASLDKGTVADNTTMAAGWDGVPDMHYPLVEKIERLAYLKDPSVIDFDFIRTLASYMGYNISPLLDDIRENGRYASQKEIETAVRSAVEQLPDFHARKTTRSGMDIIMGAFGAVADIVTLWTREGADYREFVPDYEVVANQWGEHFTKGTYYPSTYFRMEINVEGGFRNDITPKQLSRLHQAVTMYKPINTVFESILLKLKQKQSVNISMTQAPIEVEMTANIGYSDDIRSGFQLTYAPEAGYASDCI